jgi:hypothetical protein
MKKKKQDFVDKSETYRKEKRSRLLGLPYSEREEENKKKSMTIYHAPTAAVGIDNKSFFLLYFV